MNKKLVLIVALVFLGLSSNVYAYRYWKCNGEITKWRSPPTFYFNHISFPQGSYYRNLLEDEIDKLKNIGAGSTVSNMSTGSHAANRIYHSNGINEIFFKIRSSDQDYLGYAKTRWSRCWKFAFLSETSRLKEADIWLGLNKITNSNYGRFFMDTQGFHKSSNKASFQNTFLHEMGHALGMSEDGGLEGHEQRWPNQTMRDNAGENEHGNWNGGRFWAYPSSDYRTFLKDAYGSGESFYDFSISPIKMDYANPSVNNITSILETRIVNNKHPIAPRSGADTNCLYTLNRNTDYYLEVTFLNQGSNYNHNGVNSKVYLSANNTIDSTDISVSNPYTFHNTSRFPYTYNIRFNTGNNIGTYHIGAVVDYDDVYNEKYEGRTNGGANLCRVRIQ